MEAFRDRTVKIDVPYNVTLRNEIEIYGRDFGDKTVRGKHIAPHTLEIAAMWAVLTRLEEPKKAEPHAAAEGEALQRQDAARLHRGQRARAAQGGAARGHGGHLPRYIQDKISATRSSATTGARASTRSSCMNELEAGLDHHSLITNDETRKRYRELLALVKQEYEDIVKNEVQRAISADEDAIERLCAQLHRQRQGLHAAREGAQPVHRPSTRRPTSA